MISDLGASEPPNGMIKQPSSNIFNGSMFVSGPLVLLSVYSVHSEFKRIYFTIPFTLFGLGVLGVGVFNGSWGGIHALFALITFSMGGVAAVLSYKILAPPVKYISIVLGLISLTENVLARDDEVDRLYWFIAKQQSMILRDPAVARKTGIGYSEASFYLSAAKALERIADHAARIAHSASGLCSENLNDRLVKDMEAYSSTVLSVLDRSVESMMKMDMLTANQVADESEQLRKDGEKLIEQIMRHKVRFAVPFARVVESLERTALYSVDLAEIAINLAEKG